MTEVDVANVFIGILQDFAVIAAFVGILYFPFHFLDESASPEAKRRALYAIRAGEASTDTSPLVPLLNRFFGPRHLSLRCLVTSSLISLLFTVLFFGATNRYIFDVAEYVGNFDAAVTPVERALQQAYPPLIEMTDILIEALEGSLANNDGAETRVKIEEFQGRRQELLRMQAAPSPSGTMLLLWMLSSVAISMNLICDYIALGKTRVILRKLSATTSSVAIAGYLILDTILAVIIWVVAMTTFFVINQSAIAMWNDDLGALMVFVAIVSLATTLATSIWIYTFLVGGSVSVALRRVLSFLLRSTTSLLDPTKHAFKVIGVVGSVVNVALLVLAYLALKSID